MPGPTSRPNFVPLAPFSWAWRVSWRGLEVWKSLNFSPWSEGNFVIFVKVPDWLQIYTLLRFGCGDELSGSVLSRNLWFVSNESSKSQGHFETQKVTIFETLTPSSFAVKTLRKTKLSVLLENTRIYIQTEFRPSCTFFLGVARPRSLKILVF